MCYVCARALVVKEVGEMMFTSLPRLRSLATWRGVDFDFGARSSTQQALLQAWGCKDVWLCASCCRKRKSCVACRNALHRSTRSLLSLGERRRFRQRIRKGSSSSLSHNRLLCRCHTRCVSWAVQRKQKMEQNVCVQLEHGARSPFLPKLDLIAHPSARTRFDWQGQHTNTPVCSRSLSPPETIRHATTTVKNRLTWENGNFTRSQKTRYIARNGSCGLVNCCVVPSLMPPRYMPPKLDNMFLSPMPLRAKTLKHRPLLHRKPTTVRNTPSISSNVSSDTASLKHVSSPALPRASAPLSCPPPPSLLVSLQFLPSSNPPPLSLSLSLLLVHPSPSLRVILP